MQISSYKKNTTRPVKYFLLVLLFSILSTWTAAWNTTWAISFNQYFQTEPQLDAALADSVTQLYLEGSTQSPEFQQRELDTLTRKITELQAQHSNTAIYWFINGLHHRNMAARHFQLQQTTLANQHIQLKDQAYQKAIELDSDSKTQLSAAIYSTMKHGLPEALRIQATELELALGGAVSTESSYWYLHWSHIDQLQSAGREDEAMQAYRNMRREMRQADANMSVYKTLNQSIEKTTLNIAPVQQKPASPKSAPEPKPKAEPAPPTPPAKPIERRLLIVSIIVGVSGTTLIILLFYEVRRRRKKRR